MVKKTTSTKTIKKTKPKKTVSTKDIKTPSKTDNKKPQQIKVPNFVSVESTIGAASLLALKSQFHKHLFISDYEWFIMPPIAQKQFMLFRGKNNEPIAFVSWASVSKEVETRLLSGITKLQPKDWKSGNNLYIIDIISPYNVGKDILKQLHETKFKNQDIKLLRPKKTGKGIEAKSLKDVLTDLNKKNNK